MWTSTVPLYYNRFVYSYPQGTHPEVLSSINNFFFFSCPSRKRGEQGRGEGGKRKGLSFELRTLTSWVNHWSSPVCLPVSGCSIPFTSSTFLDVKNGHNNSVMSLSFNREIWNTVHSFYFAINYVFHLRCNTWVFGFSRRDLDWDNEWWTHCN